MGIVTAWNAGIFYARAEYLVERIQALAPLPKHLLRRQYGHAHRVAHRVATDDVPRRGERSHPGRIQKTWLSDTACGDEEIAAPAKSFERLGCGKGTGTAIVEGD
jgi:hypothetical protein